MGSRREDVMSSMVIEPTHATVRFGVTIDVEGVEKVAKGRGCRQGGPTGMRLKILRTGNEGCMTYELREE